MIYMPRSKFTPSTRRELARITSIIVMGMSWMTDASALKGFTSHTNPEIALPQQSSAASGLLPDLQTVVPSQVQLVRKEQAEFLRFSNGIANTGSGPLQMRPEFPGAGTLGPQKAYQQFVGSSGNVVDEQLVGEFAYHPAHNHWHIGDVALFEVRMGSLDGPVFGQNSIKTTFCLIDWYALDGNANTSDRTFWDCADGLQGVSPGWVDQYHQSLEGQSLDMTGAPEGTYYLLSTSNPVRRIVESDYTNNSAWISFVLDRRNGNPKISVIDHSPCATPALCGEGRPNR